VTQPSRAQLPVVLLMVVGVVAVSMSAPIAAGMTVPALAVAFWRNALGTVALSPAAVRRRTEARALARREVWLTVAAGAALAVHFGTWIPSLRLTSVASATSLVSLQVAWVVVWELRNGRRYPRAAVVGLAVALAGTVVVSGVDLTVSWRAVVGDVLALVGGMGTAAYMVVGARVRQSVTTTTYTFVCYGACSLLLLLVCLVGGLPLGGYPLGQWGLLLALTASAQLLGHSVFNHLLSTTTPARVGLVLLLEVPGASLLAAVFLHQRPPLATFVGLAVILVGMALVIRNDRSGLPAEPPG
jgi:drug/metabolite transporter (DMT)-like permease